MSRVGAAAAASAAWERPDPLVPLLRQHQRGLRAALMLVHADDEGDVDAAVEHFVRYWDAEGHDHLRVEEEVFLPFYAQHRSLSHPAVVRLLVEHVELRARALKVMTAPDRNASDVHDLGLMLHDNIRYEERTVYTLVKQTLRPADLNELSRTLLEVA